MLLIYYFTLIILFTNVNIYLYLRNEFILYGELFKQKQIIIIGFIRKFITCAIYRKLNEI